MQPWVIVTAISLAFTVPVLASAYYALILLISSFRYPKGLGRDPVALVDYPRVSVLIAAYNEKFVVSQTLDALKDLAYPKHCIQVVVADDSTDETSQIIDWKIEELNRSRITAVVSRRESRDGFKSGALNLAARLLEGEYVLLLDADSIVTPDVLARGIAVLEGHAGASFVSYRVGHYNRNQNIITQLFALSLDMGDTLAKMGSYSINGPFSFQGGFTLVSARTLREVGFWSQDTIVDDADLSCKIYASGRRGVYLSSARIFGEDPPTLEVWKKQGARVAQGWAKCIVNHWRSILGTPKLSTWRKIALLLQLTGPFSGLSWIVVTFISALALLLGLSAPANSIFSNPLYLILVSLPIFSYFVAAAYSLRIQKIMSPRNLLLLPLLSYTGYCMLTATSIGFVNGIMGRTGFFFRTPKSGPSLEPTKTRYFRSLKLDKIALVEGLLAVLALVLSIFVILTGVWFLGLTLVGFGVLTLKSMNLSRLLRKTDSMSEEKEEENPRKEALIDSIPTTA